MANYYLDFVGLNTFIYEPVGYDLVSFSETTTFGSVTALVNYIGAYSGSD